MDGDLTFEEFVANQAANIPIGDFVINMILGAVLAALLYWVYVRYGVSLSNRKAFARNFYLITLTTLLIITVVKSSLALSLGLVGALSIVRFRTAIKEPEELTYTFLSIAIGLGLGADQRLLTIVAFAVIIIVIWAIKISAKIDNSQNVYLSVTSQNTEQLQLDDVVEVLRKHCDSVSLKRFDDSAEFLEAVFSAYFSGYEQLEAARAELKILAPAIRITFLEQSTS